MTGAEETVPATGYQYVSSSLSDRDPTDATFPTEFEQGFLLDKPDVPEILREIKADPRPPNTKVLPVLRSQEDFTFADLLSSDLPFVSELKQQRGQASFLDPQAKRPPTGFIAPEKAAQYAMDFAGDCLGLTAFDRWVLYRQIGDWPALRESLKRAVADHLPEWEEGWPPTRETIMAAALRSLGASSEWVRIYDPHDAPVPPAEGPDQPPEAGSIAASTILPCLFVVRILRSLMKWPS